MKKCYRSFFVGLVVAIVLGVFSMDARAQMAAIAAIDEPEAAAEARGSAAEGGSGSQSSSKSTPKGGGSTKKGTTSGKKAKTTSPVKPKATPAPPPASFNGPVLGDKYTFLNYEVASAEKPYYTRAAKAMGAKGLVQVEVLVSTDGSVISAKARTGNKELWPEAERAARASKFNRPTADGRPARAIGFLVYRFGPPEE